MSILYLALAAMNLGFIGLLPRIFFRADGRRNAMWWATAAPFFLCGAVLVTCFIGIWYPWYVQGLGGREAHESIAAMFASASMILIAYTIGSHRVPLALWHQENDAPQNIVTYGAYKHVRHPFYSAFLLALSGAFIGCPHPGTLACLVYAALLLNHTARGEERKLCQSEFGEEYRAYIERTGRFVPRFARGSREGVAPVGAK